MTRAKTRAGFTLIELLAVLLIVGILSTVLIVSLGGAKDAAQRSTTEQKINMLEAALEDYFNEYGDYPPSTFDTESGVGNDGTNVGIEVLVVSLWSDGFDGGGLTDMADELQNVDGDRSSKQLTDFGTRELLEVLDDWGNPLAYLHNRDYEVTGRTYLTYDVETGEELLTVPVAFKNPNTGQYYRNRKFQLISAGSDARFGTEDDVTSFDRASDRD